MARYVVIDVDQGNLIVNAVEWDGVTEWSPPEGCIVEQSDTAQIGDIWS